jgi:hypothetical protein
MWPINAMDIPGNPLANGQDGQPTQLNANYFQNPGVNVNFPPASGGSGM